EAFAEERTANPQHDNSPARQEPRRQHDGEQVQKTQGEIRLRPPVQGSNRQDGNPASGQNGSPALLFPDLFKHNDRSDVAALFHCFDRPRHQSNDLSTRFVPQGQQLGDFPRYRNIPPPRRLSASPLRRFAIEEVIPLRDAATEFFESEATQEDDSLPG